MTWEAVRAILHILNLLLVPIFLLLWQMEKRLTTLETKIGLCKSCPITSGGEHEEKAKA